MSNNYINYKYSIKKTKKNQKNTKPKKTNRKEKEKKIKQIHLLLSYMEKNYYTIYMQLLRKYYYITMY